MHVFQASKNQLLTDAMDDKKSNKFKNEINSKFLQFLRKRDPQIINIETKYKSQEKKL